MHIYNLTTVGKSECVPVTLNCCNFIQRHVAMSRFDLLIFVFEGIWLKQSLLEMLSLLLAKGSVQVVAFNREVTLLLIVSH